MPTTRMALLARVTSLCCAAPFALTRATVPFDFKQQPTGGIDRCVRIEDEHRSVIGGFNFSEDRTALFHIWIARKYLADPHATYAALQTDVTSLTSAIVRDGAVGGGDYAVLDDGMGVSFQHDTGQEYALARLSLPINFESVL
jgi:hypothetical protein